MDFINEMENMFLQAVRGAVEPALWEAWWDAHAEQLKSHLSPGYFQRIKPGRKEFCTIFTGRDILWKTALTITK